MLKKLYDWMGTHVNKPYGVPLLGLLFFIEAIFFVPVDPLLILFCLENRKKAMYFATVATIFSVLGGAAGYLIGWQFWDACGSKLIEFFTTPETFNHIKCQYEIYETWAVLIAGFTPLPYKAVTLTAGFCKLPFIPFLVCSLISRGARFFLVAIIIRIWGVKIKEFIDKYFNLLALVFAILVVGAIWIFK
ncbi:DedA family protein [bacterium]|jgi:membrane protein YqaA with SNARE-associated domain|nr:DedA family protein [bacterium]